MPLLDDIASCTLCADRFAATATAHRPRPVTWFRPGARILISGQAPGMRVHKSGRPFDDPSGERLREWMGLDEATFWDKSRVAIVPMAFCFPGYNAKGSDLPPPKICAKTWASAAHAHVGPVAMTVLIGGYAQEWHLGRGKVTDRVRDWRDHAPAVWPLPHPSWRNTSWLKKHQWFADETLPALRIAVQDALA